MSEMTETQKLLADVEAFLERTGMAPSMLGHRVVNDGKLVARLRRGGAITLDTAAAVRAYMDRYLADEDGEDDPAGARQKKVVAQAA